MLFDPIRIGPLEVPNRFVKAATSETMADADGHVTDKHLQFYEPLARGGTGLIITGNVFASPDGRTTPYEGGLHVDAGIPGWKRLVDTVHRHGAKIMAQINHGGRQVMTKAVDVEPVSASDVRDPFLGVTPRPLREEEIHRIQNDFVQATVRAQQAGFDGVQIHAGHGYLINQFLSPYTNRRRDRYGGSRENRLRFLLELYDQCRAKVGKEYPLILKYNGEDKLFPPKRGITIEESVAMARVLAEKGFDAIEVTCAMYESGPYPVRGKFPKEMFTEGLGRHMSKPVLFLVRGIAPLLSPLYRYYEGYNVAYAAAIKKAVGVPVIVVGGLQNPSYMEALLKDGKADLVSLARALVADPELPNKVRKGRPFAVCSRCNKCIALAGVRSVECFDPEVVRQRGNGETRKTGP